MEVMKGRWADLSWEKESFPKKRSVERLISLFRSFLQNLGVFHKK